MTAAKVAQRTAPSLDEGVDEMLHRWRSDTYLLALHVAALYPDDARGDEARAAIARAEGQS